MMKTTKTVTEALSMLIVHDLCHVVQMITNGNTWGKDSVVSWAAV